ncbi:MAG: PfkB family carbohydrate kinase [Chloroflexi bacterium]|nr:PfkB family carbohydrate kinase [Chloroflexota bacterium]
MAKPSFLVVGHVTKDLLAGGGYTLGGGATFASLTAARLRERVALLTRAEPAVAAQLPALALGIELLCLPSQQTTTFENIYTPAGREQRLLAVAEPIGPEDVPEAWRAADRVLLAPVAGELPGHVTGFSPGSLLCLALQGWLRRREPDGQVRSAPWLDAEAALARADLVVLSEEDVKGSEDLVTRFVRTARLLALTRGARGATLFHQGRSIPVAAFPAQEVDPTGAGDVFAAAFLSAYRRETDPLPAARFASCVASFVVERQGSAGVPTLAQVRQRLHAAAAVAEGDR